MRGALEPLGYAVLTTEDPREAIQMCRDRPEEVDLLLMDVVMLLMDGRKLALRLRAPGFHLKVLLMSGHGLSDLEETEWRFLVKPFSMDDRAQVVALTLRDEPRMPSRQPRSELRS